MAREAGVEVRFKSPGPQPNGLQATPDGLWYIDQGNDRVYKLDWESGATLFESETETDKSSGITVGGGYMWIAPTYDCTIHKLRQDSGETVAVYDTPGKGVVAFRDMSVDPRVTGAHGLEWRDGLLWIAVPPSQMIYTVEPEAWRVVNSFKAPGLRVHGIAFTDDGMLWSADTAAGVISLLDPKDGRILETVRVASPTEVHGMTIHAGVLWFADAETCNIGTLSI
jgi:streptogramin lyase